MRSFWKEIKMKIAHVGLASFYTEGMTYQDNQLAEQNVRDGHEVLYISNAAKYVNGEVVYTGYEDSVLSSGVRLVRLPYETIVNAYLSDKLRKVNGLYELLESFEPDVIFSHALCYLSVFDVIKYKKAHPHVRFYADIHTDEKNSGRNWVSLNIQHKIIYRHFYQKAYPYLEKFFFISRERKDFAVKYYGLPEDKMEFYPLGGTILGDVEYEKLRAEGRAELGAAEDELVFIHSGKLDAAKRTEELLRAFADVAELKAKLFVCGSIPENMEEKLTALFAADERVSFLGWKSATELIKLLCACDFYLQPGSQSATMENALCCRTAVMLYPHKAYTADFDFGNVVWVENEADMKKVFTAVKNGEISLDTLGEISEKFAGEFLDYRKLAARMY